MCWIISRYTLYSNYLCVVVAMRLTKIFALSLSVLLMLFASSHVLADKKSSTQPSASDAQPVGVAKVTTSDVPKMVDALGTLVAIKKVTVSSEVSGRVASINFKDGQQVGKGMPIVQLDNQQAKAQYQSAVTEYQLAQQKYDRSKSLVNVAISKQDLEILKADVATKKASVQSKLADLNEKEVVAPFSGTLGAFKFEVGDYINAGDALVTLVNTSQLKIEYDLTEKLLPELKIGQLVRVSTSAYPNQFFYGTVSFISPTVSSSSRMVALQALVGNKSGKLSPGMFVRIGQQVGTIKHAMVVPAAAINADIKGYYVYRIVDNRAQQVYVKIGLRMGANTQVLSGLKPNDTVVVAGQQKIDDGSVVKVTSSN